MTLANVLAGIGKVLGALPPETVPLVSKLVRDIGKSDDPVAATRRALEVVAIVKGFDEAMKRRAPRKKTPARKS